LVNYSSEVPVRPSDRSTVGQWTLAKNIAWGTKWGLSAALLSVAWTTLVRLASGTQPFDEVGLSYGTAIAAYSAFGVLGGILLGLFRPLTVTRLGSAIIGWLLAFVVYTGFITLQGMPPWRWGSFMLTIVLLVSLLVGATAGIVHWKRAKASGNDRQN
jgi:hypothetical protein